MFEVFLDEKQMCVKFRKELDKNTNKTLKNFTKGARILKNFLK